MRGYDATYVLDAQRRLGSMLDFAVNGCEMGLADFYQRFLDSGLALRFSHGEPSLVAGHSGLELACMVLGENDDTLVEISRKFTPVGGATPEYWTGWALAYYQWECGRNLPEIQNLVSISQVHELYHPFHEMDITQFCDRMDEMCAEARPDSALKTQRVAAGLSQSQLALAADMSVRTLQQYEQRRKDINKAQVESMVKLSRALHCDVEDLLEYSSKPHHEFEYAYIEFE